MRIDQIKKTFVLQQDSTDCGVACLLSIIQYYGGSYTIENLRKICGTSIKGTSLLGLYQGAIESGFEAEGNEASISSLIIHNEPSILHVLIDNRLQHFIVFFGYRNNRFIIGDPAKGVLNYTKEELSEIWVSKKCLTLKPNGLFEKKTTLYQNKKRWIINLLKEDLGLLGISVFFGLIISILGMVMALFSQKLIDDLLPSKDFNRLMISIGLVAFLLIARLAIIALRQYILIRQSKQFNNRLIHSFYSALLFLPKSFFDTRKIGELIARLNDTSRIQRVITQIAGNFVIDLLLSITSVAFLFYYSWRVAGLALLSLPVYFYLIYKYNYKIISKQKAVMHTYALSESNYLNTMLGISTIKNCNRQIYFSETNKSIYGNFQNSVFDLGKINIQLGILSGLAGLIFLLSILSYASFLVFNDLMLLGELMAIIAISSSLIPSVSNLALIAIPINEARVAFNRMFEFTNISPENCSATNKSEFEINQIEFKNLSFRFPGQSRVLESINIKLSKGELVAITGESGSGKTTLASLLQKFYTAEIGGIIINETRNLNAIDTHVWREKIGVVPQDIHIFNGSVIDNICLGDIKEGKDDALNFLIKYQFNTFIDAFPHGYLTLLGEEGINLSGGQKQIIAIARALYRKPQVLILDEATSAMDKKTEDFVFDLLLKLKNTIAVFYISHRFHTLKKLSDKIFVLKNNRIHSQGTHQELMQHDNLYSEYWSGLYES